MENMYQVDMTSELGSLIFVDGMTDIRSRSLHCDLAGPRREGSLRLSSHFNIKLRNQRSVSSHQYGGHATPTSTQSSSSTLPLASTLTCFKVSRARSYDSPCCSRACNTLALSTRPGVSVVMALRISLSLSRHS